MRIFARYFNRIPAHAYFQLFRFIFLNIKKKIRSHPVLQKSVSREAVRCRAARSKPYVSLPYFMLKLLRLAGLRCPFDRRLAVHVFLAWLRSFRVSDVHVDCSRLASGKASSLTWSGTRASVCVLFFVASFCFLSFRGCVSYYVAFILFASTSFVHTDATKDPDQRDAKLRCKIRNSKII